MEFRILGPLEVLSDGRPLDLSGRKARVLLALLLLEPNRVVSRDRLVDALWDEAPPDTAHKALQVHVSQLRKALGHDRVETVAPGYRLRVEPGELDLERFLALQAEGRPDEALALWRGPALADVAGERFAAPDAARLEELRLACLEERFDRDLERGAHAEVTAELEALARAHPRRERLRGQLMLCLYRAGRQAEALEVYRETRETLVEELGIEPGRDLRELHQAILEQDPALDVPAPPAGTQGSFVGRARELSELAAGLDDALAGRGRVFLLAGEPGIGKSRLAEELAARARARGAHVVAGRCWEAGGAPAYWPWVQALRALLQEGDPEALRPHLARAGGDLTTILPEARGLVPDLPDASAPGDEGARFRLLEAVGAFLGGAASARPLALVLDDLHAADAPSLLLLRFLATQLPGSRVLIVGCYRDTEVGPDLADTLAAITREASVRRLALGGLSSGETAELLAVTMRAAPAGELAARVHAGTQGSPLFATEMGRLLAAGGAAADAPDPLPIPESVREAIARRLHHRSASCHRTLTLASAVGREFDPAVIARVGELEEDELIAALDEAASARLVGAVPEGGGRLRFSHILVRDALYEELPPPRRTRLHLAIADALEDLYAANPDPHLSELAHHYLAAGPAAAAKGADYAERAGHQAAAQLGYEEAARHYARALGVLKETGDGDGERACELLLAMGEVLSRAGRVAESKRALRRTAELAEAAGRPGQLARAALAYGGRFTWARASTDPALTPLLERALEAVGTRDSPERVHLLARLAAATRDDRRRERRVAFAEEALAIARRSDDPVTLGVALEGHWIAVEGPPDRGRGIAVGAEVIALGEQVGDKERVYIGHDFRLHGFWTMCDRAGIDVELDALRALADELGQPAQRWHESSGRTILALMEGRFEAAERLIDETVALGRQSESWNAVVSERLALFVLRRAQGRLAEVEDLIRRSVHEYPALLRFPCALAHLYGELRREREARAAFDAVASLDLAHEHVDAEWLFSMCVLADPCAFLEDTAAADTLYGLLIPYEDEYAHAPVEAAFGSVARALGVLATTLERFDDAERHFEVAVETERAMRARPWVAHAQSDHAQMLRRRGGAGDDERAAALEEAAAATYRELGMESFAAATTAAG